jgi:hypothetical protein
MVSPNPQYGVGSRTDYKLTGKHKVEPGAIAGKVVATAISKPRVRAHVSTIGYQRIVNGGYTRESLLFGLPETSCCLLVGVKLVKFFVAAQCNKTGSYYYKKYFFHKYGKINFFD